LGEVIVALIERQGQAQRETQLTEGVLGGLRRSSRVIGSSHRYLIPLTLNLAIHLGRRNIPMASIFDFG
jgi:hypothetical protein